MCPHSPSTRPKLRWILLAIFLAGPLIGMFLSFSQVLREGVDGVEGLVGLTDISLSISGGQVYAVSNESSALTVFSRSATSEDIVFVGAEFDGQSGIFGLQGASGVSVSPDGRHVFVSAEIDDTLAVFARDATTSSVYFLPAHVQENLVGGVVGLDGASSVSVFPDDSAVAVTGRVDSSLVLFSRNPATDDLDFEQAIFDEATTAQNLGGASSVVVSQDSNHIYVGAFIDDAITHFVRVGPGLTFDYFSEVVDDLDGVNGIDGVTSMALSPDGTHLYATGQVDDALAVFQRNSATGALTYLTEYRNGVGGIAGISGASSVLVSAEGTRVVVAGRDDNSVAIFRRDATGELVFLDLLVDGVDGADGLAGVVAMALSSEGADLVVAGRDENAVGRIFIAACFGDPLTGDSDHDAICDDSDFCLGDDFTGDADGDGICFDRDCDDGDPTNPCHIFSDGFESGDIGAWL